MKRHNDNDDDAMKISHRGWFAILALSASLTHDRETIHVSEVWPLIEKRHINSNKMDRPSEWKCKRVLLAVDDPIQCHCHFIALNKLIFFVSFWNERPASTTANDIDQFIRPRILQCSALANDV